MFEDRGKAAINLVLRVFEVDVPDAIRTFRFDTEKIAAGYHCGDHDLYLAGLADAAHGDDATAVTVDNVVVVEKITRRDRLRIAPDVRGSGDLGGIAAVALGFGPCLVVTLPRCILALIAQGVVDVGMRLGGHDNPSTATSILR